MLGDLAVLDRMLHRAAFSTLPLQKAVAEIESQVYRERIRRIAVDRPVFVSALPRAGTTMLLDALYSSGAFATHTYRDMPFLLTPLLWDTLSRRFRRPSSAVARAHGDGMTVGFDSPEAFEEVLWRAFWPKKYPAGAILHWTAEDARRHREFRSFFRGHVAKVVALRRDAQRKCRASAGRYLSKNNANIARFEAIGQIFPDASFVVPFRNPCDQAGSLLRQHRRFGRIHAEQPFARRYMRDLGHFEFGADLRAIRFPSDAGPGGSKPTAAETAQYWLEYWCAAYAHVLESAPAEALLVSCDRLCAEPKAELGRIAAFTGLDASAKMALVAAGSRFRAPARYADLHRDLEPQWVTRAAEIHRRLMDRSVDRSRSSVPSSPLGARPPAGTSTDIDTGAVS